MKSMKSMYPHAILVAMIAAFGATASWAQDAGDANVAGQLKIATGKKGKGYSKLFADIQAVCGSRVSIAEVETEGGLQNLTTLASNQADLGFVQIDTLQDMKGTDESIAALVAVMSVNSNLLHIVANAEGYSYEGPAKMGGFMKGEIITRRLDNLSDLKGLPIALVGSAQKLGRMLNRSNSMGLVFADVETDEQALSMLKRGEVAAMFSTSGWPNGALMKLKQNSGMKLLGFDMPTQAPYQVVRKNYTNLGSYNISFLASPNLLLSRPFKPTGANGKNVAALQTCISKNLLALQEGRYEPAWAEVKNTSETYGWPRFSDMAKR